MMYKCEICGTQYESNSDLTDVKCQVYKDLNSKEICKGSLVNDN